MSILVSIPKHCNGPPTSGNGGYSCGLLASQINGAARVRLHTPPPLEVNLHFRSGQDESVAMYFEDTLVGTAWPASLELDIPPAPSLDEARQAGDRYPGYKFHEFPGCYVCGPERSEDGLCIFPGPVRDWNLLACVWQPRPEVLDERGNVRDEILWSALDCPGYFGARGPEELRALLGELTAELYAPVPGRQPLIVYCWPMGRDGRKAWGGTAIASAEGTVLAASYSLWISPNE